MSPIEWCSWPHWGCGGGSSTGTRSFERLAIMMGSLESLQCSSRAIFLYSARTWNSLQLLCAHQMLTVTSGSLEKKNIKSPNPVLTLVLSFFKWTTSMKLPRAVHQASRFKRVKKGIFFIREVRVCHNTALNAAVTVLYWWLGVKCIVVINASKDAEHFRVM